MGNYLIGFCARRLRYVTRGPGRGYPAGHDRPGDAQHDSSDLSRRRVSLSSLKGKNVLLIFPRGFAAEARWCTIDNYKYAELVDFEKSAEIRKKYDVEIVFVFPYGQDVVKKWVEDESRAARKIKGWKNPADPRQARRPGQSPDGAVAQNAYPKEFSMEKGKVPRPSRCSSTPTGRSPRAWAFSPRNGAEAKSTNASPASSSSTRRESASSNTSARTRPTGPSMRFCLKLWIN